MPCKAYTNVKGIKYGLKNRLGFMTINVQVEVFVQYQLQISQSHSSVCY